MAPSTTATNLPHPPEVQEGLTHSDALVVLYAAQQFLRIPPAEGGRPYGAGYFEGRRAEIMEALGRPSRGSAKRLLRRNECVSCKTRVPPGSTGDHLIPLHDGGSDSIENHLPMCRCCNSSKGRKDLLEWWESKERGPLALGLDALTVYARLKFRWLWNYGTPLAPAPAYLEAQLRRLLAELPSDRHRRSARKVGLP
jgi:hypothetical protein